MQVAEQVAEGLEWRRIYWISGTLPKHAEFRNAVKDPPCLGWQHAFVMPGEKHSTIFCPYTLTAFSVYAGCSELVNMDNVPPAEFRLDFIRELLERNWTQFQGFGYQRDYDTCALVMRRLGLEVPAQILTGGEEDTRKKGGKEVETMLKKPVKASSKRGKFLQWFLDGDCTRSVREAMAEFSMTRSNALSYLYMIQKDHGIGYTLVGDNATITLPEGCENPFDEPTKPKADDDDDSWLD
ncbi:MAG: hypothetical protein V3S55_15305 [Nitrospiraceae bacterium]